MLAVAWYVHRRFNQKKRQHRWTLLVNQDDDVVETFELDTTDPNCSSTLASDISRISEVDHSPLPSYYDLIMCVARFGLIMGYFFLCDRTNFFMKENKYYTHPNFFLPIAYVFALGLFFTEESRHTVILHRDQTDEWKGWMQLIILTYHMTVSNVL